MAGAGDCQIPIIDYSMLLSTNPDQRLKAIDELAKACLQYGYFMLSNHGVPERLINDAIKAFTKFFDLPEEEKAVYETNDPQDCIRLGRKDHNNITREFLLLEAHPQPHFPSKPQDFKKIMEEYYEKMRGVGRELLRGISRTLGFEEKYIEKALNLGSSGYDFYAANDYPLSLKSQSQLGQFPHYDPGLLILHVEAVGGGLQVRHQAKWVKVDCAPNCIFVTIADHLEVLTNGKYKSVLHQVALKYTKRRVTLPLFIGPPKDMIVNPAAELLDEHHPAKYIGLSYKECLEANSFHVIEAKSCLKKLRLL